MHVKLADNFALLKSNVRPSQKFNRGIYHEPWVMCGENGTICTGECTCVARKIRACSHAGALLWKIEYAVRMNLTGKSYTDHKVKWNMGTTRNIERGLIKDMDFQNQNVVMM